MARTYGSQSMVEPLRRVGVHRPGNCFGSADPTTWHYASRPDLAAAQDEHDRFVALMEGADCEVVRLAMEGSGSADAIYTHDPCIVTDAGAVLLRMGKAGRRAEPATIGLALDDAGVPVLGALEGTARAEGGDLLWIDHETLAVGQGFRTNAEGLRQLGLLLEPLGIRLVPVPLPYGGGPDACLHLMSLISLVDRDLAVVYSPLLSVPFRQFLQHRDIDLVEVPEQEFGTMGPNVLALAPRECLMLEGNPRTQARLESAGCRVRTYRGEEISRKAEGGPTCLTRPILRTS